MCYLSFVLPSHLTYYILEYFQFQSQLITFGEFSITNEEPLETFLIGFTGRMPLMLPNKS